MSRNHSFHACCAEIWKWTTGCVCCSVCCVFHLWSISPDHSWGQNTTDNGVVWAHLHDSNLQSLMNWPTGGMTLTSRIIQKHPCPTMYLPCHKPLPKPNTRRSSNNTGTRKCQAKSSSEPGLFLDYKLFLITIPTSFSWFLHIPYYPSVMPDFSFDNNRVAECNNSFVQGKGAFLNTEYFAQSSYMGHILNVADHMECAFCSKGGGPHCLPGHSVGEQTHTFIEVAFQHREDRCGCGPFVLSKLLWVMASPASNYAVSPQSPVPNEADRLISQEPLMCYHLSLWVTSYF